MKPEYFLALSWFYAILLTAFALITPRATRAQLLFGVQVDLQTVPTDLASKLRRRWTIGVLAIGLFVAFLAWLTSASVSLHWLITEVVVCLAAQFGLYLWMRRSALPYAAAPSDLRPVELPLLRYQDIVPRALEIIPLSLLIVMILTSAVYYPALPATVPTHFGFTGQPDQWAPKSPMFFAVMLLPAILLYTLFTAISVWTPRSSRLATSPSLRQSLDARRRFVVWLTWYLFVIKVLTLAMLTLTQLGMIAVALNWRMNPMRLAMPFSILLLLVAVGGAVYFALRLGQGGSRALRAAKEKLEGAAADESHWRLGIFYYNPEDPSLFVEKRFGVGFTINFGNRKSWLFIGLTVALVVTAAVFALAGKH